MVIHIDGREKTHEWAKPSFFYTSLSSITLSEVKKVRISRVSDSHDTRLINFQLNYTPSKFTTNDTPNTEEFSSSSTKTDIVSSKVMDASLGEHGIILELRFTQRRAVASNQHQFG